MQPPRILPHATAHDMVRKGRSTRENLETFLAICNVSVADMRQWLAAWERSKAVDIDRPHGAVRVVDAKPRLLGVHAAIKVAGVSDSPLPEYVLRDIDIAEFGIRQWLRMSAAQGGFLLLVGGSSVGKTRSAFEALRAELPDWWLIHPDSREELTVLTGQSLGHTVVWLDELQNYLCGDRAVTCSTLRALLTAPKPIVILGTIRSEPYASYISMEESGGSDYTRQKEVLDLADIITVVPEFSAAERNRAREAAKHDRRIHVALSTSGYGLTQALAAAPQLIARWENSKTNQPYAWAIVTAALDAVRLGAWAPLSAELLRVAAVEYCTEREQAEALDDWFEKALAYSTRELLGAAAMLTPASAGMRQIAGYRPAEYLLQYSANKRCYEPVPKSLWEALGSYVHDPGDTARLAQSAANRLLYGYAVPFYRRTVASGDRYAARKLADLLHQRGDLEGAAALLGKEAAGPHAEVEFGSDVVVVTHMESGADRLVNLLAGRGDLGELRARAEAGDESAAARLALLLAKQGDLDKAIQVLPDNPFADACNAAVLVADLLTDRGDLDQLVQFLRVRADTDDYWAAERLADLLAEQGDLDGLRARADSGDRSAAERLADLLAEHCDLGGAIQLLRPHVGDGWPIDHKLADLLAEQGDLDGLGASADAGNRLAALRLADLLAERGDLDGLRARADSGDSDATRRLVELFATRGDVDGLRAWADAGDWEAAPRLNVLLAERGDLDGLRARVNSGDSDATGRLANLLATRGDIEAAVNLLYVHANLGDRQAAIQLADLLAKQGDIDRLRSRADAGDSHAAGRLADLLLGRGHFDSAITLLQAHPDAGYHIARRLVDALAERRDLDRLHILAGSGQSFYTSEALRGCSGELSERIDAYASRLLADHFAKQGDIDGLRTLVNSGIVQAAWQMASLLMVRGYTKEADLLQRFGFTSDGVIASSPTW